EPRGPGAAQGEGSAGPYRDPTACGNPEYRWDAVYDELALRPLRGSLHPERRGRGSLRAAVHLPWLPLRLAVRPGGGGGGGRRDRRRAALGAAGSRRVRVLGTPAEPAPAQYRLGPEGKLP